MESLLDSLAGVCDIEFRKFINNAINQILPCLFPAHILLSNSIAFWVPKNNGCSDP